MTRRLPATILPLALAAAAACAQPPAAPKAEPAKPSPQPQSPAVAPRPAIPPHDWKPGSPIQSADDLLVALETAGAGYRTFQANLNKTRVFPEVEGGGMQVKTGRVFFLNQEAEPPKPPAPATKARRMFQVDFTTTISDGVKRTDNQTFIFDGQWLVERQPDVKQIHKRQVVPPGQTVDPLAIGEGPFPIPIGQKRERILQRFTADLLPPEEFPDAKDPVALEAVKDTYQLRLKPRPGTDEAKQFKDIRIWYRTSDLLPQGARTVEPSDSVNIVRLSKIQLNQPLPNGAFDVSVPEGWDAQIDEYRGQAAGAAAP